MNLPTDAGAASASARWRLVQEVLADAIECPPAERRALLDRRCHDDTGLRHEVESLLAAHDGDGAVDRLASLVKAPNAWIREPITGWAGRRTLHYHIEAQLGEGGMGVVYRARDERLGRQVALKFLPPHMSADADAKARFVAEARAAAALDHPNVCAIYEIGETDDGQLFIAMPYYEGETLQARLDRGRLTFGDALPILTQVACGLSHAHEYGIVHRDVKPSNIVLLADGTAKVLDFGIAKVHDAAFNDRHLVGTIAYMSPEQASGGIVDARSDVWSLAIVAHEMLSGRRPFRGDDGQGVLDAILGGEPELTATTYPDVPAGVDAILRRALSKRSDQRYASTSLLAADIAALSSQPADAAGAGASSHDERVTLSSTERRRAAVLVTVVSGYAALVDQNTPADAQRLIASVRDAAVDVVREYGGLVNQAIGEEIVSVFGVPAAHDDDDLRAVRAAMALQARVAALDGADGRSAGLSIQSGLHVGPVVARRLHEGPRRFDIVGAAPSMAARLAALAEPSTVLISPETQRLVAPYMQTTARSPVVLDPKAGPVTPFRVIGETGIATRLEASTRSGLTPYVGRQPELSMLEAAVRLAASGTGQVIAILGEAGAGKSRLLYELQERVGATRAVRLIEAGCRAYGDAVPYGVFVQVLCDALDLRGPLPNAAAVVGRLRAADPTLEPFLPLFLHLLSVKSDAHPLPRHLHGEHLQAAMLDALAALVGVLTARGPVVLLIEDWQWADTGSRAALARVAEVAAASPLVLVVTSRLEPGVRPDWPAGSLQVQLEQLDFDASAAILQSALGVERVAESLARRLYDRAGGNPFFLEQMCAALREQRAIVVRNGEALIDDDDAVLSLPETVQGVIRARLDNLSPQALETLRVASVIGAAFDHALLAEVVPTSVDLGPALTALADASLIQQTTVAPTIGYRFTHTLTQEVCYDSLVGHQRKALHGAIGRALMTSGKRMDDGAAALAHHFGRAEDWPSAIHFGRRAADRAIALSQFAEALATLDDVLAWVGHLPDEIPGSVTADVLLQQERLCETLGLRARQQEIIDGLIAHLARDGSSARLAEVYLRQGDLSTLLKRFDAADRALGTALRIGHERGDAALLRSGLRSLGLLRWHEGRHAEALDITRRALAVDRESDDQLSVALDLTNLGNILKATGDHAEARARLEEALAMPVLREDPRNLVYTQHNLANVYRAMGDLDQAMVCLRQSDEIARLHLLPIQRSFHLTSMAHIQLQQGDIDAALETYRAAVDLSRRARHADGLVQSLRMLGDTLLGLGRYDEALPCLREAASLFALLEDRGAEAEMLSSIARILERQSPAEAPEAWRQVLDRQRKRGDARGELDAREGLARAGRVADPIGAIPAFEAALALAAMIGAQERKLAIRNALGSLEWDRGSYQAALAHYEAALALVRQQGDRVNEPAVLNSLGVTLARLGRPDEARTVLEDSVGLSRSLGERQLEAHALAGLGQVALGTHDLRAAIACFEQSLDVRREIGDRAGEGWMQLRLAALRETTGDLAGARAARDAASAAAAAAGDATLASACARAGTGSSRT